MDVSQDAFDRKEMTVPAALPELERVLYFIGEMLTELQCSDKDRMQIRIAVDEVFSNIVRHSDARKGDTVTMILHAEAEERTVEITFMDGSPRFDPLSAAEPDLTAPARKRAVGGLGLLMLKRMMDDVSYKYEDGMNILTIRKKV